MNMYPIGERVGDVPANVFDSMIESYQNDVERESSSLSIYNPDNPEIKTARSLADEMINVSGAEVKVYIRTDNADFDAVWDEDPDPTYWNMVPMKAFFKPDAIQAELKEWGVETLNKTDVIFSHRQVYEKFKDRMLRPGDVLILPYNALNRQLSPSTYRIVNATPSGNFKYSWLYFTCTVESITQDITVKPTQDVQQDDEERGTFYESH
jgi:hypothetical protein